MISPQGKQRMAARKEVLVVAALEGHPSDGQLAVACDFLTEVAEVEPTAEEGKTIQLAIEELSQAGARFSAPTMVVAMGVIFARAAWSCLEYLEGVCDECSDTKDCKGFTRMKAQEAMPGLKLGRMKLNLRARDERAPDEDDPVTAALKALGIDFTKIERLKKEDIH